MTDQKKVSDMDLSKAIAGLQDLAKGHSSKGTNALAVESMTGEGGATQVHHTAGNSDPGTWAGTGQRPVGENGAKDSIAENGTDYQPSAEMVKSIMDKLAKGQALTAFEVSIVKGFPFAKKDDDKDDDKEDKDVKKSADMDEDDKDVKKSLAAAAAANETLSQGMEISDFLSELVGEMSKSLTSLEDRMTRKIVTALSAHAEKGDGFNKSLAVALAALGEGLAATVQRVDLVETAPARAPKSQIASLEKSFHAEGEPLSKAIVADELTNMVKEGKATAQDVIRFESNGQITEHNYAAVRARRAGK
jgi:hypothetical protein